jgi:hypothetical protein
MAAVNDSRKGRTVPVAASALRTDELGTWLLSLDGPQIAARLNEEQFQQVYFEHPLFDNRKKS